MFFIINRRGYAQCAGGSVAHEEVAECQQADEQRNAFGEQTELHLFFCL